MPSSRKKFRIEIEALAKRIDAIEHTQKDLEELGKDAEKASEGTEKLDRESKKTERSVEKLGEETKETGRKVKQLGRDAQKGAQGVDKLDDEQREAGRSSDQLRQRTEGLGAALRRNLSKPAMAGGLIALGAAAVQLMRIVPQMTMDVIRMGDGIGKVADKVGVSTDLLQGFRFAADQTGVATSTADMGMQRFSRRIAEVANGTGELLPVIEQYNIQVRDSEGNMRSAEAVLGDFAELIRGTKDPTERLRIAFKAFDSEGAALVNTLNLGREGLYGLMQEAEDAGIILEEDTVRAFERAQSAMSKFATATKMEFAAIVGEIVQAVEAIASTEERVERRKAEIRAAEALTGKDVDRPSRGAASAIYNRRADRRIAEARGMGDETFADEVEAQQSYSEYLERAASDLGAETRRRGSGRNRRTEWILEGQHLLQGELAKNEQIRARALEIAREQISAEKAAAAEAARQAEEAEKEAAAARRQAQIDTGVEEAEQEHEQKMAELRLRHLSDAEAIQVIEEEITRLKLIQKDAEAKPEDIVAAKEQELELERQLYQLRNRPETTPKGDGTMSELDRFNQRMVETRSNMQAFIIAPMQGLFDSLNNSIQDLIKGTMTWQGALLNIGGAVLSAVIATFAQVAAAALTSFLLTAIGIEALAVTSAAAGTQLATSAGAAAASAWIPAAIAASIATYGLAAGVGGAAFAAAMLSGALAAGAAGAIGGVLTGLAFPTGQAAGQSLAGARASGGPVVAGRTYMVGELGPEPFTPSVSGTITSNADFNRMLTDERTSERDPQPAQIFVVGSDEDARRLYEDLPGRAEIRKLAREEIRRYRA